MKCELTLYNKLAQICTPIVYKSCGPYSTIHLSFFDF